MRIIRPIKPLLLLAMMLPLSACIFGKSTPAQFFMLEPLHASEGVNKSGENENRIIALAPIRIPQYVDRPQMVVSTDTNSYRLSETNRWAERLDDNIARVLAQDLTVLVPADLVLLNASSQAKQARYKVWVNLLEFHVDPAGQAELTAQWRISRNEDSVLGKQSAFQEAASTTDYHAMAGALNQCLHRLSREIAEALRKLPYAD